MRKKDFFGDNIMWGKTPPWGHLPPQQGASYPTYGVRRPLWDYQFKRSVYSVGYQNTDDTWYICSTIMPLHYCKK